MKTERSLESKNQSMENHRWTTKRNSKAVMIKMTRL